MIHFKYVDFVEFFEHSQSHGLQKAENLRTTSSMAVMKITL